VANALANSQVIRSARRWLLKFLPFPVLESDVRDVVYLNWVVPVDRAASLVPAGIELASCGDRVVFSILSYRHGHFGPRMLGPMRRIFPSPLQSNWRFYVSNVHGRPVQQPTVLFVRNAFDSTLYAIGTRLGSDALPSDATSMFVHRRSGRSIETKLQFGESCTELAHTVNESSEKCLPAAFTAFFRSWDEAVNFLTRQDAAIVQPPDLDNLARADIALPIDPSHVRPVEVARWSGGSFLDALGIHEDPFCFLVPDVRFRVLREQLLRAECARR
jgi:hypothetical protein